MTYSWVCDDQSKKQRMYMQFAQPYLVVSQCDKMNFLKNNEKRSGQKQVLKQ